MVDNSLLKRAIDEQSWEYASDQSIINNTLISMLINYRKDFYNFIVVNDKKIKKFLKQAENDEWLKNNFGIVKIFKFLFSGLKLINDNDELNEENFKNYKVIMLQDELDKNRESLLKAENNFDLKGIQKINNNLQFILAFRDNTALRRDYFKEFLWELNKEKTITMEEKDYRTNIFERLMPKKPLNINQYNRV